ncbi:MAG TPA: superoxide dismutase [Deltaproteobacteria bacterium]|nr:MAG: superoxide dismutase [Deltaproteobacteria bacterium GWA2_45_12]HBF12100.1 superoxide dismutase [Deltaproteobacteria bacterium]
MFSVASYKPRHFNLSGLEGISDKTLEMHFELYEGYVQQTNNLTEKIAGFFKEGQVDWDKVLDYSELKRRLGFEYNGMILHEYYFENLKKEGNGMPSPQSLFSQKVTGSFQTYEAWKNDFIAVGKMRGVGWAICYLNPANGQLSNHWITLHEVGNVAGFTPILVMDVWEHAFLLDYPPSERAKYIEAFFSNINWDAVDKRLNP